MRLRIKVCRQEASQPEVHRLELADNSTLQQLRDLVKTEIYRDSRLGDDIHLSLNRKDEVEGSPDATLKAVGVCIGDVLWLLGGPAPPPLSTPPIIAPQVADAPAAAQDDTIMQDEQAVTLPDISPADALAQLVHAALLDCGLILKQVANTAEMTATRELAYCLSPPRGEELVEAAATCTIKHVLMGRHLVVWGNTQTGQAQHISLEIDDYITPAAQISSAASSHGALQASIMSRLWAKLADDFIHPLVAELRVEDSRPPLPSVQVLPLELKLLCLRHLSARDLAALVCMCRGMRHVASSVELWEPLYTAEFGPLKPSERPAMLRIGLKQAFGQAWAERARMRRQRRRFMQPTLPYPGSGPHALVPSPSPFPGIAGGEFDRLPHPFLGLPRSGGGVFGGSGAAGLGFPLSRGRRGAMHGALL